MNTSEFIKEAEKVHGVGTWDYTKTTYLSKNKNVTIGCPEHGDFSQRAARHLAGNKCTDCVRTGKLNPIRKTPEDVLATFDKVHGNVYTYGPIPDRANNSTKISISCELHGWFDQSINCHSMGHGCPKCKSIKQSAAVIKMKEAQFKQKVGLRHNFKYTYENVNYTGHANKISITCKEHGDFSQTPRNHIAGQGCPKCGLFGYKKRDFLKRCKNVSGLLYIIRCYNTQEEFIKIGITSKNSVNARYIGNLKMPYLYEVLWELYADAASVYDKEKLIHNSLKAYSYNPSIKFSGMSECFTPSCLEHIKYEL